MQLIDLALHIPNFVPENICDEVIDFYENQPEELKFRENSYNQEKDDDPISSGVCLEINKDNSVYENIHKFTGMGIDSWIRHINDFGIFQPLALFHMVQCSHSYRVIKYYDNLNIHDHVDAGVMTLRDMAVRGSCTLNFSDANDYEGGEFRVFRGMYQVKLGKGDLMIFPADAFWVHGTNPVTSGARYAVNSFLHTDLSRYEQS